MTSAKDAVSEKMSGAADTVKQSSADAKEKAQDDGAQLGEKASEKAKVAGDKAQSGVDYVADKTKEVNFTNHTDIRIIEITCMIFKKKNWIVYHIYKMHWFFACTYLLKSPS